MTHKKNLAQAVCAALAVMAGPFGTSAHAAVQSNSAVLVVQAGTAALPANVRASHRHVAAGDSFSTRANESLEVLLPDGTSLLLGPSTTVTVQQYVYDDARTPGGRLVLQLHHGRMRISGGAISANGETRVLTSAGEVNLTNASASLTLEGGRMRVGLLSGDQVRVTQGAAGATLARPGFEVIAAGGNVSAPIRSAAETLVADAYAVNPGLARSNALNSEAGSNTGSSAQLASLGSGASGQASFEQPLPSTAANTGTPGAGSPDAGGTPTPPGATPIPPPPGRPGAIDGALAGGGFGPGSNLGAPNAGGEQGSASAALKRTITQNRNTTNDAVREKGGTTNRLFKTSSSLVTDIQSSAAPSTSPVQIVSANRQFDNPGDASNLQYVFMSSPSSLGIDAVGDEPALPLFGAPVVSGSNIRAPFLLGVGSGGLILGADGVFSEAVLQTPRLDPIPASFLKGSILDRITRDPSTSNTLALDATVYRVLQTGFASPTTGTGTRAADNFLFLEARAARAELQPVDFSGVFYNQPTGNYTFVSDRPERFIFAAGDVDGTPNTNFAVQQFFLSAGFEGFSEKSPTKGVASGMRAFQRNETGLGLALADSGVLIAGRGAGVSGSEQNALLHADFGLSGSGDTQKSTISVTIGDVDYVTQSDGSRDAIVSGDRTLGSSHDNTNRTAGKAEAATLISSPFFSTAAGGGNPDVNMSGRAGYFVFENYDPSAGVSATNAGTEKPLNTASASTNYATLRLATATGNATVGTRTTDTMNGFVAGMAEFQSGANIGVTQLDSGDTASGFTLNTNATNNRVAASVSLYTKSSSPTALTLGGLTGDTTKGQSAFIDDKRFAARGANGNVALVSGDLVKAGLPAAMQSQIANYQHLQWGFFFGDVVTTAGAREHAHLASWIAGKVPNAADLPITGTATYGGHAIGNVYSNGSISTAVGSYANAWNFASRQGNVTMNFDNATYTGTTALATGTASFSGQITTTNRAGGVFGSFVQGGSDPAAAQMGRFSINETSGALYRASGTFGAEKQ